MSQDLRKFDHDLGKLCTEYLENQKHTGNSMMMVASILLKHTEFLFASIEENSGITPEDMQVIKRKLTAYYRKRYGKAQEIGNLK